MLTKGKLLILSNIPQIMSYRNIPILLVLFLLRFTFQKVSERFAQHFFSQIKTINPRIFLRVDIR